MVKVLSFSFKQGFDPFQMYLLHNPLKGNFLDIYLTTFFGVRKFKNRSAMRVIFSLKIFKIESKFRKCKKKNNKKNEKNIFVSEIIASENVARNASFKKTILVIDSQWVNKESQDFPYKSERNFQPELFSRASINMVKVLYFSFEQCLGPFIMLLLKGFSERGLFKHLPNHVFWGP